MSSCSPPVWLKHVSQKHDAPLTRRNHPRLRPFVEATCFRQRTVTPAGYVVAGQRRIVRASRHFAVRIEHDRYAVLLRIGGKNTHPTGVILGTTCKQCVNDGEADIVVLELHEVEVCAFLDAQTVGIFSQILHGFYLTNLGKGVVRLHSLNLIDNKVKH